jgi:RimJ/RimL family protein N-acetyltransferase
MLIREAREDDAAEMLSAIERLIAEPHKNIPWNPLEFKRTVEDQQQLIRKFSREENSVYYVAEADGKIIGEINLKGGERLATRHIALIGIFVDEAWRGQGVGHALMQQGVEWGRQNDFITRLELLVYARNTSAIALYKKLGFEIEGRRRRAIFQDGEYLDNLMMALLL